MLYNSNTVSSFSDTRILNLYNPSKMSSHLAILAQGISAQTPHCMRVSERPTARWGPFSCRPTGQTSANLLCSRTMASGTFKGEPRGCARKQVSGLEAAIAAMIASGMDENSPEVTTLRGSLAKAKRNAQEAPLAVQVKGAKNLSIELRSVWMLTKGQARLQRLRKQVEEEAKSPPAVPELPPEWVSEIHRLRSEVARFKASANRPVRDSVEAATSVRAKAEKRRAGVMDNIPADQQSLRAWMEEKNLEMRDALDANDVEALVSLGSVIAQGANQLLTQALGAKDVGVSV